MGSSPTAGWFRLPERAFRPAADLPPLGPAVAPFRSAWSPFAPRRSAAGPEAADAVFAAGVDVGTGAGFDGGVSVGIAPSPSPLRLAGVGVEPAGMSAAAGSSAPSAPRGVVTTAGRSETRTTGTIVGSPRCGWAPFGHELVGAAAVGAGDGALDRADQGAGEATGAGAGGRGESGVAIRPVVDGWSRAGGVDVGDGAGVATGEPAGRLPNRSPIASGGPAGAARSWGVRGIGNGGACRGGM